VQQRGADLQVVLKRTSGPNQPLCCSEHNLVGAVGRFGGVPLLLLNFGEITEVATSEDEIVAQRNEVRGRDAGDVTTLLVPWREVQRGPYFVSVLNAWEPPAEGYGSKQIDVQDCDLTFRLVARLSEPLAPCPTYALLVLVL